MNNADIQKEREAFAKFMSGLYGDPTAHEESILWDAWLERAEQAHNERTATINEIKNALNIEASYEGLTGYLVVQLCWDDEIISRSTTAPKDVPGPKDPPRAGQISRKQG